MNRTLSVRCGCWNKTQEVKTLFEVGLLPLWLKVAGVIEPRSPAIASPTEMISQQRLEPESAQILASYLKQLQAAGFDPQRQGVWLQTEQQLLLSTGGDKLHSGASLTKAATTLAVLHHYPLGHRFRSQIRTNGSLKAGILSGDLIVEGGLDLVLMPAAAIAFGQKLQNMGIQQVRGDLVVQFPDANALVDPDSVGTVLREGINANQWSEEMQRHYQQHLAGTPKPTVVVTGTLKPWANSGQMRDLWTHQSPPILDMVRYMNLHSSNDLAEAFVADMGGVEVLMDTVLAQTQLPPQEIQLQNGSGLGVENRMSPRAVTGIFLAIQNKLAAEQRDLGDAFPISGQDIGTLEDREIPLGAVVKTGTLWNVSALSGYFPTAQRGRVWFTIMNDGGDFVEGFRQRQDQLLARLTAAWSEPSQGSPREGSPPM
ncbi:D-alanyl-D-alanine carboxypeptidase [Lyngbya confervoides]|uniref:D-alanyl-D-alanine carboxypeptidase n=1 Tax=Lyngbya confervoides BDU141951 TaxID=1574623 RepID=A0ABD4T824_9CYAN|nr:D-alanyl-D-alanine carboxypeptidase [Lyngbya confervoides]MCM1984674.1 D-alanyl-D-alanine carboxypeptidase [Lyngbya confervoides BDU141951]